MRRLYYLFPDQSACQLVVDELLKSRIEARYIHVLAKEGIPLGDLPPARLSQTKDIRHSLIMGSILGFWSGIVLVLALHYLYALPYGGLSLVFPLLGLIFGAWTSSMIGLMVPNVELKPFQAALDEGQLLLMVDVPRERLLAIEEKIAKLSVGARFTGVEPMIPPFP